MSVANKYVEVVSILIDLIRDNFSPEDVFTEDELIAWADGYGFVLPVERQEDDREL